MARIKAMPPTVLLPPAALALLACPVCRGALAEQPAAIACTRCGRIYPVRDGIPVLIAAEAVTPSR